MENKIKISVLALLVSFASITAQKRKPVKNPSFSKGTKVEKTSKNSYHQKMRFGVKAGGSYNFLNDSYSGTKWDMNHTTQFKTGGILRYYGGAMVNILFSNKSALQPELLYIKKGEAAKNINIDENQWTMKDYIAVPVLFQYTLFPKLYVEAGPEISYSFNSKFVTKSYTTQHHNRNKIDIGLSFGAGYFITKKLAGNFRFTPGFINVFPNDVTRKATNRNLQFGINYFFN